MSPRPAKIRIAVDGRPLAARRSGIGRYVYELCRELNSEMADVEFIVFSRSDVELPLRNPRWKCVVDRSPIWAKLPGAAWLEW